MDVAADIISEILEEEGIRRISAEEPPGPKTLTLAADLSTDVISEILEEDGKSPRERAIAYLGGVLSAGKAGPGACVKFWFDPILGSHAHGPSYVVEIQHAYLRVCRFEHDDRPAWTQAKRPLPKREVQVDGIGPEDLLAALMILAAEKVMEE